MYPVRIPLRSTVYFCVTFFLKVRAAKNFKVFHMNGDGLRTCAPVKSIKTSQQVFIGFKNLPIGYYRKLKTCGQSMCSNGRLAIETSIKNLISCIALSLASQQNEKIKQKLRLPADKRKKEMMKMKRHSE